MIILHKGKELITLFYFKFVYKTNLERSWHSLQSSFFLTTQCFSTDTLTRTRMRMQRLCSSLVTSQEWSRYICVLLLDGHSWKKPDTAGSGTIPPM